MPGERRLGVPFLFGSFLFGHAKRKELGLRQQHETALSLAKTESKNSCKPRELYTESPCKLPATRA